MKKLLLFISSMLCSTLLLAATPPLKPLTVVLDWFVNPQHAPIIIAEEQGFFKQQGLDVTIVAPADPDDPPKLVAVGKADIAIGYQPELYLQVQGGLPLVRIGTLVSTPLSVVAVLQSSNIHSLSDLKGKTIGYSMSGIGTAVLDAMLKSHGVDPASVKYVDVHYNLVQALASKQVDAVSDVQTNFEIPELAQMGQPARTFSPQDNGVPTYDALIFLANRNALGDPRLLAFMQAIQQAVAYMQAHPVNSWQLLIKHHPELNNPLNQTAWQVTLPDFTSNPLSFNARQYQNFAQWMFDNKLINKVLPLDYYSVDLTPKTQATDDADNDADNDDSNDQNNDNN